MVKIKLELKKLVDAQLTAFLKLVGTKLDGNATFPTPPVPPDSLEEDADDITAKIAQRDDLLQQAQQKTLAIAAARAKAESDLTLVGGYVEGIINKIVPPATTIDPVIAAEKARSVGLDVADQPAPVGPMPKIAGLVATQGDDSGEVDLHWDPIRRGLSSYLLESSEDPTGLTGWSYLANSTKSSYTAKGLVSGKRYWFRVTALGAEGPGPHSDPTTKTAA